MSRVAIVGAGSWGTVFGMVLADAGREVVIWGREARVVADINDRHRNDAFHTGVELPAAVSATTDIQDALGGSELIVLALPAQVLRENLRSWGGAIAPNAVVVSLIKGIELGTSLRMSQVIAQGADIDLARIAVVSGPNLAKEIAARQPTATTVASADERSAMLLQESCTTEYFRPYWTTDVVGTEIGGAVKNVIALANGIAVGLGLGENSQASLMTRGLAEMARLGVALGADALTFQGLAGVGDLVATCQSPLSRNRTFGVHLGQGMSVSEAVASMTETCEAVKSCQPILELARSHGVDMPITEQVVEVVHHGKAPSALASAFMSRDRKAESRMG